MTKIGLLVGRENTFPPALISHINSLNAGITAEYCLLGGTRLHEPSGYAVIIDRLSHEVPYYRSYLKNAALNGTVIVNDPFWFPADDKFIGSGIAERLGVAVPRTVALPNQAYIPDITAESLRNLMYPLPWQELVDYIGLPAFLKPSVGGGWKQVFKVHSVDELIRCYDQTGQVPMILQENIDFDRYVRCICFGGEHILPMRYNPKNPNMLERYEGEADAAFLGPDLHRRIVGDARRLNQALGYTMNTVEFAVRDSIPYAIDFLNPVCDLDSFSIGPHAFEWALNTLADLAIGYARQSPVPAHTYRWRQMIEAFEAPAVTPPAVPTPTIGTVVTLAETPAAVMAAAPPARTRTGTPKAAAQEPSAAPAPARKRSPKRRSPSPSGAMKPAGEVLGMEIASAVELYNALLEGDDALARESGEMLTERQPGRRLTFGGRPMCLSLRPQFLDAAHFEAISRTCTLLAGATKRLEGALLADARLLDVLDLSDTERRLALVNPGFEDAAAATRLDSFIAGDSWQFVEYNAESPAGMGYTDLLDELFRELPVMRAFQQRVQVRSLPTRGSMLETLLRAYRQWGGRETPLIAIVDWEGLATATEFEIFQEFFALQGVRSIIVTPQQLEFRDGRLYAGATPIELVYRRVLTHELLARPDEASALIQAYEAGAACVVNAFRCKLLHKKAIFAVLSDEQNAHLFTPEEQVAIRRHIPWTRKVGDGYTTYNGSRVDLAEHVLSHRERLVLKPNDEYGGKGVVLGWETEPHLWEESLREAMAGSFVVQERVQTEQTAYPIYDGGSMRMVEMTTDLDPYIFGQRQVDGLLTRISAASLLNVTAGTASTLPTFLIEGAIG